MIPRPGAKAGARWRLVIEEMLSLLKREGLGRAVVAETKHRVAASVIDKGCDVTRDVSP